MGVVFVAFSRLFLIATFLSVRDGYLVGPEGDPCLTQLTCYDLATLLGDGNDWYSDSVISFQPGIYNLSQPWVIANVSNVTLLGAANQNQVELRAVFQCEEGAGLLVNSSDQIYIIGLTFVGCGVSSTQSASLLISLTLSITLDQVSIINGTTNGLMLEDSANFTISNCSFIGNSIQGLSIWYSSDTATLHSSATPYNGQVSNSVFALSGVYGLEIMLNQNSFFVEVIMNDVEFYSNSSSSHISVESLLCSYNIEINNFSTVGGKNGLVITQSPCSPSESTPTIRLRQAELKDLNYCGVNFTWPRSVNGLLILDSISVHGIRNEKVLGAVFIYQIPELSRNTEAGLTLHGNNLTFSEIHSFLPLTVLGDSATVFWIISVNDATLSDVSIFNNTGTGLQLYSSVVYIEGNNLFHNNSGLNGGAVALLANSFIILLPPATVNFTLNRAQAYGGAIFTTGDIRVGGDAEIFVYCRIQQAMNATTEDIVLYFSGNEAGVAGSLVYGGDLDECTPWLYGTMVNTSSIIVADDLIACDGSNISSPPRRVYLCRDICPEYSGEELQAAPGQVFTVTVVAVGQNNGSSPGGVQLTSSNLVPDTINYNISSECTTLNWTLQLKQSVDTVSISLSLLDPSIPSQVNIPRVLDITVMPCPAGFQFSLNNTGVCVCAQTLANVVTECDIVNETVAASGSPWIAYDSIKQCITAVANCPFNYCKSAAVFSIVDPDQQCANNRSGILCGSCKEGLSVLLVSDHCSNCSVEDTQWRVPVFSLLYVLFTFALIVIMIGLNLTVSTGLVNGPLFFISVVEIYERIFFPNGYTKILLNWFVLSLGIKSCWYDGMDACGRSWVEVSYSIIFLLDILFLIFLSVAGQLSIFNRCPTKVKKFLYVLSGKVSKFLGTHAIPILATVFLISFARMFMISIHALYAITLQCCDVDGGNCSSSTVWYVDGSIPYLHGCHLPLFIFSVMILILFSLFTFELLLIPCLEHYISNIRIFHRRHVLMKPWYDANGGPYKDKYRSWTGILLLVRCILGLVVSLTNNSTISLAVLSFTCLLFTSFLLFFPVYKSAFLNSMETLTFASLSTMALLTGATEIDALATYSIFIMFNVIFFLIILYHIYQRLLECDWFRRRFSVSRFSETFRHVHWKGVVEEQLDEKSTRVSTTTVSIDGDSSLREPQLAETSV